MIKSADISTNQTRKKSMWTDFPFIALNGEKRGSLIQVEVKFAVEAYEREELSSMS